MVHFQGPERMTGHAMGWIHRGSQNITAESLSEVPGSYKVDFVNGHASLPCRPCDHENTTLTSLRSAQPWAFVPVRRYVTTTITTNSPYIAISGYELTNLASQSARGVLNSISSARTAGISAVFTFLTPHSLQFLAQP